MATANPPTMRGQSVPAHIFPITTNINLHGNCAGQVESVEYYVDIIVISTNDYVLLHILRDPKSGYYYWIGDRLKQNNFPFNIIAERRKQFLDFWLIQGIGLIDGRCRQGMNVYNEKIENIQLARSKILSELKVWDKNFPWPGMAVTRKIDLPLSVQALGFDFFYFPMESSPPPEPKPLSICYTNFILQIQIESSTARSNRIAIVDLDSSFKVIKTTRSN
jgi:hypothetical protein